MVESGNLSWLRQYRERVADVDPETYFEAYREELVPFATGETGRRHYREIADHLADSNRPAFLDELDKAGF